MIYTYVAQVKNTALLGFAIISFVYSDHYHKIENYIQAFALRDDITLCCNGIKIKICL